MDIVLKNVVSQKLQFISKLVTKPWVKKRLMSEVYKTKKTTVQTMASEATKLIVSINTNTSQLLKKTINIPDHSISLLF